MTEKINAEKHDARTWDAGKFQGYVGASLDHINEKLTIQNGSIKNLTKLTTKHESNWTWFRHIALYVIGGGGIFGAVVSKILGIW